MCGMARDRCVGGCDARDEREERACVRGNGRVRGRDGDVHRHMTAAAAAAAALPVSSSAVVDTLSHTVLPSSPPVRVSSVHLACALHACHLCRARVDTRGTCFFW